VIGDDRGFAGFDRFEEVAVRYEAEALVPGVVAGREMRIDIVVGAHFLAHHVQQFFPDLVRMRTRLAINGLLKADVFPARDCGRKFAMMSVSGRETM
jgi:hypothetical protein